MCTNSKCCRVGPETAGAGVVCGAKQRKTGGRSFHFVYFLCMLFNVNPGLFEVQFKG